MKKIISFGLLVVVLASCGKKAEYLYNESLARLYYQESGYLEGVHNNWAEGNYETQYEQNINNPTGLLYNAIATDIKNLENNTNGVTKEFELLSPSEKAKAMHEKTQEYFMMISTDYLNTLKAYAAIDCDCPHQKDSIGTLLNSTYDRISTIEDEMLDAQRKYLEEIGMTGVPPKK